MLGSHSLVVYKYFYFPNLSYYFIILFILPSLVFSLKCSLLHACLSWLTYSILTLSWVRRVRSLASLKGTTFLASDPKIKDSTFTWGINAIIIKLGMRWCYFVATMVRKAIFSLFCISLMLASFSLPPRLFPSECLLPNFLEITFLLGAPEWALEGRETLS